LKKITLFLLSILMISLSVLVVSCREKDEIHLKDIHLEKDSIVAEYILPRYREELLKDLQYRNFYRISISVDREKRQVEGILNIRYYNNSGIDLREIFFRLYMNNPAGTPMLISSVEVGEIPVDFSYSEDFSSFKVELNRKLIHGQAITLKISYSIDFSNNPDYFFGFAGFNENSFSLPHFYPTAAAIIKGEWILDKLISGGDLLSADSSWYLVEIETDDKVIIVTTGIEVGSDVRGGKQKRVFTAGPVRDFFICGDESFIPSVTISGETDIVSYSPREDSGSSAGAAQITSSAISLFNSKFGFFPFNEMKVAALPMTVLGVEFPGLFAINEKLYKETDDYLFEPTIVHETAHQWFYSLVGNNQLREPWLDEGFAQYAVWLYYRERYGSSAALNLFNSFIKRWERVNRENIPINKPVDFYKGKEYGAIIYGRAPLFLIEVGNIMGEEEFLRFIRHLITRYSYKFINTEIFREELFRFSGKSMDSLFSRYFDLEGE